MEPAVSVRPRRILIKVLVALFAFALIALLGLGFWPTEADLEGDEATAGAGSGRNGLDLPFPAMIVRPDNATSDPKFAERAELGRLLFFDPILSGDNTISCATCHHPDFGFSDGRALSMGKGGRGIGPERIGGATIRRSAPTLWNAAYNHRQFWDGRAADLEEQAISPITSPIEMAEDPQNLVRELRSIPEYVRLFDSAFGGNNGSSISLDAVAKAIAAFERTLTANNAPFDRYVAGDRGALTEAQLRGFNIFRSGKARCFECHGLPTFANPDFKVLGVPDLEGQPPDLGRGEVVGSENYNRAFKVPTLRNVVLTAPYMHNGRFKTLEEVLDFYARGGGPGMGFNLPNIDDKIRAFSLSPQEKEDLIAFLYALTDESRLPAVPERVPSGLTVVPRIANPARQLVARYNVGSPRKVYKGRQPKIIIVREGQSIQQAIDEAQPGDTIEVLPGIYNQSVAVDLDDITLRGMDRKEALRRGLLSEAEAARLSERPVLDGKRELSDAVIATGNNFRIEGFQIRHYTGNGVAVHRARNVTFRDLIIDETGRYGVYPVSCTGVLIERVTASGISDAAIYVGQSRDIIVRNSTAHDNVTGIEIENSVNALVENNYVYNNAGGILVFVLPNNPSKVGRNCRVVGNRIIENNHFNFADPTAIVSKVPSGTGIMIMAADDTEVTGNQIRGNQSYGVAVVSLRAAFPSSSKFDVGAVPEGNRIHGNTFSDNGRNPVPAIREAGLKGADLLWDGSGWSNTWDEPSASRAMPLPSSHWPAPVRRLWWRLINIFAALAARI
jgi:parallel beta-helix repeat protein